MISLQNKKCLVTGATRGIGKEISLLLENEGCTVFKAGIKDGDLSTSYGVFDLIKTVKNTLSNVDILINNAGRYLKRPIEKCTVADCFNIYNTNVISPWILCKEFIPYMKEQKWGRVVNIGSLASYHGHADQSLYNASKHAILGMSRALFKEVNDYNVRVFCVSPGGTQTDMGQECLGTQEFNTFLDPKEIAEYIIFNLKFNNQLISTEIQLNRIFITRLEKII
jgi:short-subunit dehydrogenase